MKSKVSKWWNLEMYSTHNEWETIAVKFIRTLKNKIYKYRSPTSKKCIDKLDDVVNKYKNTYQND